MPLNDDGEEICIVGGGIMGIMTAYYLVKSNRCKKVFVIEEGELAGGASGKAAGFLAKRWHGGPTSSLGVLSYELHAQLANQFDGQKRYGYRTMPSISMHIEAGKGKGKQRIKDDPLLNWMNGDNISDLELMEDDSGTAQVHPKLFCETIVEQCKKEGVSFVNGRAIGLLDKTEGYTYAIHVKDSKALQSFSINAHKLVIAAGPWTKRVAKELLDVQIDIRDLPGHSIVLKTKGIVLPALAIFASAKDKKGSLTATPEIFTRPDGTIYIAGENSGAPLPANVMKVERDQSSLERLLRLCQLLSAHLDINNSDKIESFQSALCYRPISSRGYPFLGSLQQSSHSQSAFVLAGHGPWGISLGPGSGKVMSEIILNASATSANVEYLQL